MRNSRVIITLLALLPVWDAGPAWAQADASKKRNPFGGSPLHWTVDPIIDRYVQNMTRHYNLNKEQEQYTRMLMTRRVKQFP